MRLNSLLSSRTQSEITGLSLLSILVIGFLDYGTGKELSFSVFYLLPIALGAWYGGRTTSLLLCVLSAIIWFAVDYASGHRYSHPGVPFWNALVRFGFFIIVATLLQRLRQALDKERTWAERDGLTGLLNARVFRDRCTTYLAYCRRHRRPLTLIFMDTDNFKHMNDAFGHNVGDRVLKAVADVLSTRFRAIDVVGRLGGDEFAVALPETNKENARILIGDLRAKLSNLVAANRWPISFSIGVAVFNEFPATTESVIEFADALMYKAKRAGKDNVVLEVFTAEDRPPKRRLESNA